MATTACPECGAPLRGRLTRGLCPRCVLRVTLTGDSQEEAAKARAGAAPDARHFFGDYELLRELGRGGMGAVYEARQLSLNRVVALKMLLPSRLASPPELERFRLEAEAVAALDHPNILPLYEIGSCQGQPYFTMKMAEGGSLTDAERGARNAESTAPVSSQRAARHTPRLKHHASLVSQIARAVHYAHQRGIQHRDLKPGNILLDAEGRPYVSDFGLAKFLDRDTSLTLSSSVLGSPAYMSPEQAAGDTRHLTTASDVYGLGAILFELLSGRPPFTAENVPALLLKIVETEPDASVLKDADLRTICLKCLNKDPRQRYSSAEALADELDRWQRGEPILARPISGLERLGRWCRRRPALAVLSASVLLLLVVVAVGSSVAAWRVAIARQAEQSERRKAETANSDLRVANTRLADTVRRLELRRAEDLFRANDSDGGVAHLSAILRRDPSNQIAASRLVSALVHRNWALPAASPMRHLSPVESTSFSPNGRQVLTVSRENFARLWDAATGQIAAHLQHRDRVFAAGYSPQGARVVTASADGTARIWSSTNGIALTPPLAHKGKVYWAEFSGDGRNVVTASSDKTARVWDAASGAMKRELRGHNGEVFLARFNPDGDKIATGGIGGSVRIWNTASGEMIHRLQNRVARMTALEFSADGRRLVWASDDGTAQLWDPDTGQKVGAVLAHAEYKPALLHATFSPEGSLLLTTSQDGTARLWSAETGQTLIQRFQHQGGVNFAVFSPDGRAIATCSADITTRLWDVGTGASLCQPLRELEQFIHADFSPDGRRLVTASYDWTAQVWDIQPRRSRGIEPSRDKGVRSVVFSPDGKFLLTASLDRTARLFDARTGQPSGEPMLHDAALQSAQFSPDGGRAVTALTNGTALIWDLRAGRVIGDPLRHSNAVWTAFFNSSGDQVVTASADHTARVWDARTGRPITPALAHDGEVLMARFSSDGRLVVTASEDPSARVWDARTGQPVSERLPHVDHVRWAEFSPDNQRVLTASSDNTACVWSIATSRPVAPLLRHTRIVERAAFSPDGRRVVTASIDLTARVWDANTGQALTEPLRHETPVTRVCFSPDGRRILTGCWGGVVRIWDAETGLPLTESLNSGVPVSSVCFDPTGQRIAIAAKGCRVWDVPEAPTPVPAWFPPFAEAVAGLRLSDRGNVELVPRHEIELIAERLSKGSAPDFYQRLGRWFLADPSTRSPEPF